MKDPGFFLIGSMLQDIMVYHDFMHDFFTVWLRPYLSLFVDPYYWMAMSIPRISLFMYSIMDGCTHATCHVSDVSVVFVLAGFPTVVFGSNAFS